MAGAKNGTATYGSKMAIVGKQRKEVEFFYANKLYGDFDLQFEVNYQ